MGAGATVAIAGFLAYVAAVAVLLRTMNPNRSPAMMVTASAVAVYILSLVGAALVVPPVMFWPFSATYWFLAVCFLVVFGAVYKSVSLRILGDLLEQRTRAMLYEEILDGYVRRESFKARLEVIVNEGLATRNGELYELTPKGRRLAGFVAGLQRAFNIKKSG